jgi:hypothetical protein
MVTIIDKDAFKELSNVKTVEFGTNSKCIKINSNAFYESKDLKTINFPTSLIDLGASCFSFCYELTTIDLSSCDEVVNIPKDFCSLCQKLSSLKLPPNCSSIGENAFEDCKSLDGELIIPNKVKFIERQAFLNAGYTYGAQKSINLTFQSESQLERLDYAALGSMCCADNIELPSSLKTYGNNCLNGIQTKNMTLNIVQNNTSFGVSVFEGSRFNKLFLKSNHFFKYPEHFLRFSLIQDDNQSRIYVPNNLLTDFKNG